MVTDIHIIYDPENFDRESLGNLTNLFWGIDIYFHSIEEKEFYQQIHPKNYDNTLIVDIGENPFSIEPKQIEDCKDKKFYSIIFIMVDNVELNNFIQKYFIESDNIVLNNEFYHVADMNLETYIPHLITRLYYLLDINVQELRSFNNNEQEIDMDVFELE